jgi:hypothetical protein
LKPFSNQVWLLVLGACLYAGLVFWMLERETNRMLRNRSLLSSLAMSVWYSIGTLFGYGVEFSAETAAGRLLTLGLYILCMILVATYTANLASDLTLLKSNEILSGIDDLKNGRIPFNRLGIVINSAYEDYFLREISLGSRNLYPLPPLDSIYPNLLENKIDASIMDTGLLEYAINKFYCNLTLVGGTFHPTSSTIITPKGWLYAQTLDITILSLKESGFLQGLIKKWFKAQKCPDSSLGGSTAVSVTSIGGLMSTFLIVTLLSVLLFMWTQRSMIKKQVFKCFDGGRWVTEKNAPSAETSFETLSDSQQASYSNTHL